MAAAVPFAITAPDLPGHGATTVSPVTLDATLAALADHMATEGPGPLLGYSQGGRIALNLAARRPDLVTALIVISATPGLDGADRDLRRTADETLATRIETIGVDRFLDEWLTHPLVGTTGMDEAQRTTDRTYRAVNTATGLAAALRGLGQGMLPHVDPAELSMPTLWVTGTRDEKYTELAARAAEPAGHLHVTVEAGHNVVADAPHQLGVVVTDFLNRGGVRSGVTP